MRATSALRHSPWDGVLVALAFAHAAALIAFPSVPLIAILLWWNANTISHNFIHLPFFRARRTNTLFSVALTLLLGFPQSLWRVRHLAHHAGREDVSLKWTRRVVFETVVIALLWVAIAVVNPRFFLFVYLPGYAIGLGLCQLQGYFEHAQGTTSHYGWLYNALFFRDGFHVEHHERPSTHWRQLKPSNAHSSPWPAVLRWLDNIPAVLDLLERAVLKSGILQAVVLRLHEQAISKMIVGLPEIKSVAIIGGGLFPRTAIILGKLLPRASITIIDRSAASLASARRFLGSSVTTIEADCSAGRHFHADLVIVPLAFVGDREAFYLNPPAATVFVHDWIWRRRAEGRIVSWWLLKRVNLVRRQRVVTIPRRAA